RQSSTYLLFVLFVLLPRHPLPTLFPYTTLFRSTRLVDGLPFRIDDSANATVDAIAARARQVNAEERLGLIVIDYLTYIQPPRAEDRKSTRLNSSHVKISYAVFCLKKKNIRINRL